MECKIEVFLLSGCVDEEGNGLGTVCESELGPKSNPEIFMLHQFKEPDGGEFLNASSSEYVRRSRIGGRSRRMVG
tara:strand:- start:301 stop:525 length:225 start_codon:yes stop_codon:yes gene_type:complete